MDCDEALRLLKGGEDGITEWNRRREAGEEIPDLRYRDLSGAGDDSPKIYALPQCSSPMIRRLERVRRPRSHVRPLDLNHANLSGVCLFAANLVGANLSGVNLSRANLGDANLSGANLEMANLSDAKLHRADLNCATLGRADLSGVDLSLASLVGANIAGARLVGADFSDACCWRTVFADVDLAEAMGLESIIHHGPSSVGIDTLFRSKGKIPESFLRGCGVPDAVIVQQRALVGEMEPIPFRPCFIRYDMEDQEFAKHLHSKMREKGLRVWMAAQEDPVGMRQDRRIEKAIRDYDKRLVVVSPASIDSLWVKAEFRNARQAELRERKRKLFPIRLVDLRMIRDWNCLDEEGGMNLGLEIYNYFNLDFSSWKDHDAFESAFDRLLQDLKAEELIASSFTRKMPRGD